MLDRLFYEAWGWPHILGVRDSTTRQKENSESATEGTEGAEGAQDDRTTATGASTYPRDAEGWIAPAGGHAE